MNTSSAQTQKSTHLIGHSTRKGQSHLASLVEQILNVSSGFLIALLVWIFLIVPVFDIEVTMLDNLTITAIFTITSIIRGYCVRRLFNWLTVRREGNERN